MKTQTSIILRSLVQIFRIGFPLIALVILPANGAQTPASVSLSNLTQTYNGLAKTPTVNTVPAGLPVQIVYQNLSPNAPPPVSEIVYNDTPDPLALSYFSYGFQANEITALGNYVQLGGTARKLESCDVVLVTWAKATDWPALAAANPAGYIHPITITLYEVTSTNQLVYRADATENILVPWRPLTLPNGDPYPYSGYAFRAVVPFPNGITLPERVLVMVSFNTQSSGFDPIGIAGPYNFLNVAQENTLNVARVGSDVNPDVVLQVKNGIWYYPSTGWRYQSAPLVRLRALSSRSIIAPINVGSWQASARVSNADYLGTASATFTVAMASASIQLSNLTQTVDGNAKPVNVVTDPPGIAVSTTYAGATDAPILPGSYAVHAELANPNYFPAFANGELTLLGQTLDSWIAPWVADELIPTSETESNDDPDQDSINNLLEYAFKLNPAGTNPELPDMGKPRLEYASGQLSLTYRKNLGATDLNYQVDSSTQLGGVDDWTQATTTDTIIATEGLVQTVRATLATPLGPRQFLRLRVTRQGTP